MRTGHGSPAPELVRLRVTARQLGVDVTPAHRVGWLRWQSEGSVNRYARRGWTAGTAEARMLRDEIGAALGYPTRYQTRHRTRP